MPIEKKLTALQEHIAELTELKNKALVQMKNMGDADKSTEFADGLFAAYSNAIDQAKKKLATERQQHLETFVAGDERGTGNIPFNAEQYFEQTFKTQ